MITLYALAAEDRGTTSASSGAGSGQRGVNRPMRCTRLGSALAWSHEFMTATVPQADPRAGRG